MWCCRGRGKERQCRSSLQTQLTNMPGTQKKALSPVLGERALELLRNISQSSTSTLAAVAVWLKSLAGRTDFSPGKGTLNPVASYQSKWLTRSGFRESGM